MIDLNWTELTAGLALLFNMGFLLYVLTYYKRAVTNPLLNKSATTFGLVFFSLCLIIFVSEGSNSDWYHYQDLVWNYDFSIGAVNHGEPVYGYIIKFVGKNYFLFRLIVWGGAFLITCLSFKRFGLNLNIAIFFLVSVYLVKFNYARASLAMASYFFGLSFLFKPINKRPLNLLFVALFFFTAYAFHHSLLPVILLTATAYFPLDRPIIAIPLIFITPIVASFLFANFGLLGNFVNEDDFSTFSRYMERESERTNLFGEIANIIQYGAFAMPLIIDSITVFRHKKDISMPIKRMLRVTISITLFALMFLFMGLLSTVFTYRYLFMTLIPLTILSVDLYQNGILKRKLFSVILLWGIGANIYGLLYGLYKAL